MTTTTEYAIEVVLKKNGQVVDRRGCSTWTAPDTPGTLQSAFQGLLSAAKLIGDMWALTDPNGQDR